MEELSVLRQYIEQGRYSDALLFIDELEEMSKEDKLNKIFSYALILLIHLIKKHAEQRTTRSWDFSIDHAVLQIKRTNRRRKAGGVYASPEELKEVLEEAFDLALKKAALEAFEGGLDEAELAQKVDKKAIVEEALAELIEKG
jgi:CRISPR/Cas system CSM-associated protein Csm2 small subunit